MEKKQPPADATRDEQHEENSLASVEDNGPDNAVASVDRNRTSSGKEHRSAHYLKKEKRTKKSSTPTRPGAFSEVPGSVAERQPLSGLAISKLRGHAPRKRGNSPQHNNNDQSDAPILQPGALGEVPGAFREGPASSHDERQFGSRLADFKLRGATQRRGGSSRPPEVKHSGAMLPDRNAAASEGGTGALRRQPSDGLSSLSSLPAQEASECRAHVQVTARGGQSSVPSDVRGSSAIYERVEEEDVEGLERTGNQDGEAVPTLEAFKVESEPRILAVAEKDSFLSLLKRNRYVQMGTFCVCFLVAAAILAVVLAVFNGSLEEDAPQEEQFLSELGQPLNGQVDNGKFGSSIAIDRDGQRMAVADKRDVLVYMLDASKQWELVDTIKAPENAVVEIQESGLLLNSALVDISSDGMVIAIGWPSSANVNGTEPGTGLVEVYRDQGAGKWERVGHALYGWESLDYFGTSVALNPNGTEVAVGSPGNNGNGFVYKLVDQSRWETKGRPIDLNASLSVTSVAFGGTRTLAIAGASASSQEGSVKSIVARIFRFEDGDWMELGSGITGGIKNTAYLVELSADGNIVAISNYYMEPEDGVNNDALDVRVFEWNGDTWEPLGDTLHANEDGEKSGYFIALSDDGKLMGMGDPGRRSEVGGQAGHIHFYRFDGNNWEQIGPNRNGANAGDQFGFGVALSGNGKHLAAGAPFNRFDGDDTGQVIVFETDIGGLN